MHRLPAQYSVRDAHHGGRGSKRAGRCLLKLWHPGSQLESTAMLEPELMALAAHRCCRRLPPPLLSLSANTAPLDAVGNLSYDLTEQDVIDHFSQVGPVKHVRCDGRYSAVCGGWCALPCAK